VVLALLGLGACRGQTPGAVRVASKTFTESVVLGEIAVQRARAAGAPAEHRRGLGGTRLVWNALEAGEVDLYPDYTGTLFEEILRIPRTDRRRGTSSGCGGRRRRAGWG
jgi:osmoprotectant transport system permease protein